METSIMNFVLDAENRMGNMFKMHFDNLHDTYVAIKSIEKVNATLDKDYLFYGQVSKINDTDSEDKIVILVF